MKKKKLKSKLTKTKKKLATTRSQLDEMLKIMDKNGMPKAAKPVVAGTAAAAKAQADGKAGG